MRFPDLAPRTAYVIYNPSNDSFSTGGAWPGWRTKGFKIWANVGHIKNHLHVVDGRCRAMYRKCVVLDLVNKVQLDFSIPDYFDGKR